MAQKYEKYSSKCKITLLLVETCCEIKLKFKILRAHCTDEYFYKNSEKFANKWPILKQIFFLEIGQQCFFTLQRNVQPRITMGEQRNF